MNQYRVSYAPVSKERMHGVLVKKSMSRELATAALSACCLLPILLIACAPTGHRTGDQHASSPATQPEPTSTSVPPLQTESVPQTTFSSDHESRQHFLEQLSGVWELVGDAELTYSTALGEPRHDHASFRLLLNLDETKVVMNWMKLDKPLFHVVSDGTTTCYIYPNEPRAYLTDGGDLSTSVAEAYRSVVAPEAMPLGLDAANYFMLLGLYPSTAGDQWSFERRRSSSAHRPYEGVRVYETVTGDTVLSSSFSRFRSWDDDLFFPERVFITTSVQNSRVVLDIHNIRVLSDRLAQQHRFSIDDYLVGYSPSQIVDLR